MQLHLHVRGALKITCASVFLLILGAFTGPARATTPPGKATVKSATLTVYSDMDPMSDVVRTVKKGDALTVNLEIANSTGDWCSVSLPGQGATLGYVDCGGLQVVMPHVSVAPSLPEPVTQSMKRVGEGQNNVVLLPLSAPNCLA